MASDEMSQPAVPGFPLTATPLHRVLMVPCPSSAVKVTVPLGAVVMLTDEGVIVAVKVTFWPKVEVPLVEEVTSTVGVSWLTS